MNRLSTFSFSLVIALGLMAQSHASETKTLLHCTNTSFRDLGEITVIKDPDLTGSVIVIEQEENGKQHYTRLNESDIYTREGIKIELSEWYGYRRVLEKTGKSSWTLTHWDECTSSTASVKCTE